ncbi:MAG: alpha/beta hydrolase, partial [Gemmatimonadota bacterium]
GRSEGSPSERGLYRDGDAAWRHLVEERGVSPERLLVHGHSLGAAVAIQVATERRVAGVVASAGFATLPSLASRLYGWIPDRAFRGWERNRFDSEARIGRVDAPVLVVAGGRDEIVEAEEVRRLFEAAREPKRWVEVPRARHNDLLDRAPFWHAASSFADETLPGETESLR